MSAAPLADREGRRAAAQKFFAPGPGNRVPRHAILERVFGTIAPPVVVLQAPAGHGKSTTLAQIKEACDSRQILSAWLNLDESDNDSRRHANHLRGLVGQLSGARLGSTRPRQARRGPQQRSDWLIEALERTGRELALFVDEFEVLHDRAILGFWTDFLLRCPPGVRVFIASRSIPEVGLARLLVRGAALILSAEELRFSKEEVRTFFSATTVPLHQAEMDTIFRRSEGWPAAVQLFRLGLSQPGGRDTLSDLDHCRPRELAEYLTDCILAGQPSEIRSFLLRTALLDRLTAPLCDRVTGRRDSQKILLRLERAGLFVRALDSELRWFRYHSLFASLLIEQLMEEEPEAAPEIHQQAADWLNAAGRHEEALHHAVAGRNLPFAARILQHWSSRLVANGEMATIGQWLDRLPLQIVTAELPLAVRMTWALIFLHRRAKLSQVLAALYAWRADGGERQRSASDIVVAVALMCADDVAGAFETIAQVALGDEVAEGFAAFELGAAANLQGYRELILGDFQASQRLLTKAKSFNQMGDASFSGGYTACFEGAALLLRGRVKEALGCLRAGLEAQREVLDATFASGVIASCYLWALYEANDLDLFDAVNEEYRDILPEASVPDFFAVGQICVARVLALRERWDDAERTLEHAEFMATKNGWPRIVDLLIWERARVQLDRQRAHGKAMPVEIRKLPPSRLPAPWRTPAEELVESSRSLLMSAAADADPTGVRAQIVERAGAWATADRAYAQLRFLVLGALLAQARGIKAPAVRRMRQALELAMRTGLVRPLLDHGAQALDLLREIVDSARSGAGEGANIEEFTRRLSPAGTGQTQATLAGPQPPVTPPQLKSFTAREREILGYLAARLSNKEIARRTLLSENTVKYHLKNVFSKLGVGSRLEAYDTLRPLTGRLAE